MLMLQIPSQELEQGMLWGNSEPHFSGFLGLRWDLKMSLMGCNSLFVCFFFFSRTMLCLLHYSFSLCFFLHHPFFWLFYKSFLFQTLSVFLVYVTKWWQTENNLYHTLHLWIMKMYHIIWLIYLYRAIDFLFLFMNQKVASDYWLVNLHVFYLHCISQLLWFLFFTYLSTWTHNTQTGVYILQSNIYIINNQFHVYSCNI